MARPVARALWCGLGGDDDSWKGRLEEWTDDGIPRFPSGNHSDTRREAARKFDHRGSQLSVPAEQRSVVELSKAPEPVELGGGFVN